ncbi:MULTISPECIES: MDR family MFS transporter [unclassified Lysinibacillus]|uniref:MDR family MFS transporter n=1 Tax=unclassified Lysinibacillus TaxID=2636778 RepID=UPI003815E327
MRGKIMMSLMLVTSLAAMEGTIVSTATPSITSDLSGFEAVSWVFSIYLLTAAVSTPIYGKLADLLGRKRVLLCGVIIFLLGAVLCGFATSMFQLILFRAVQGLGAGAVLPITMTIIGDLYVEQQERVKAQGWISAVFGISGVIGPLFGGILVDTLSWRYIFFLNLPFGLISIFMLLRYYKENIKKQKHHIDYIGAITFSCSIVPLLYALLTGSNTQHWGNPLIISLLGISISLFIVFLYIEKNSPEPLVPLNLFSHRDINVVNVITLFMGTMLISILVYLPIWSQEILNKSATTAGFMLMPMPVIWAVGSFLAGYIVKKIKPIYIVIIGTIIMFLAASLLFVIRPMSPEFLIYMAIGLMGLGMGLITPIIIIIIQDRVSKNKRGTAVSLNTFINTFSQALGAAVFGMIFNVSTNAHNDEKAVQVFKYKQTEINSLNTLQDNLFSGIHAVFSTTLILAILTFFISWILIKKKPHYQKDVKLQQ